MKNLTILLSILLCVMSFNGVAGDYKVIANTSFPSDSITKSDLRKVFLLKKKNYQSTQVLVTNLKRGSAVRSSFSLEVLKKDVDKIERYYFKRALSGKSVALEPFSSEADLIERVKSVPGAIGYVGSEADVSGVKILVVE